MIVFDVAWYSNACIDFCFVLCSGEGGGIRRPLPCVAVATAQNRNASEPFCVKLIVEMMKTAEVDESLLDQIDSKSGTKH